jgi:hypothetical protein
MRHCPNLNCPFFVETKLVSEFHDDIETCPDCGSPLVTGEAPTVELPALTSSLFTANDPLTSLCSVEAREDAEYFKERLEFQGIPIVILSHPGATEDEEVGEMGRFDLYVLTSQLMRANRILDSLIEAENGDGDEEWLDDETDDGEWLDEEEAENDGDEGYVEDDPEDDQADDDPNAMICAIHEHELRPEVDVASYEREVGAAIAQMRISGLRQAFHLKGWRGARTGRYAVLWIFASKEALEENFGTAEERRWPPDWADYENTILTRYLDRHPDTILYTDYSLVEAFHFDQ